MHEPTYREAMRTAWQITTKHKLLFLFGIFAAFVGQLGILDLVMKIGLVGTDSAYVPLWAILPTLGIGSTVTIAALSIKTWVLLAWLGVIILGFVALLIFVSVSSHGALIHATGQYVNHPKKHVSFDVAWHAGTQHFWRLFLIVFVKVVSLTGLGIATVWGVVNAVEYATLGDMVLFILLFTLAVVVGLVISFVAVYAAGYVVLEEYSLGEALRSGWELFREHWLVSIEIGLTVLGLNVLVSLVAIASLALLFIPTVLIWLVASTLVSSFFLFQIGTILAIGIFILLIATLGAFLTVFTTALWMDLFQHMHRRGMISRVVRHLSR